MNQITNVNNPVVVFVPFGNSSTASSFQVSFQALIYDRGVPALSPGTINITITNPLSSTNQTQRLSFVNTNHSLPFSVSFTDVSSLSGLVYSLQLLSIPTGGIVYDEYDKELSFSDPFSAPSPLDPLPLRYFPDGFYNHTQNDSFAFSILGYDPATGGSALSAQSTFFLCSTVTVLPGQAIHQASSLHLGGPSHLAISSISASNAASRGTVSNNHISEKSSHHTALVSSAARVKSNYGFAIGLVALLLLFLLARY